MERGLVDLGARRRRVADAGGDLLLVRAAFGRLVDAIAVVRERHAQVHRTGNDQVFGTDELFDERGRAFFRARKRDKGDAESKRRRHGLVEGGKAHDRSFCGVGVHRPRLFRNGIGPA